MVTCAEATPAVIRTKIAAKQSLTRGVHLMVILLVLWRFSLFGTPATARVSQLANNSNGGSLNFESSLG